MPVKIFLAAIAVLAAASFFVTPALFKNPYYISNTHKFRVLYPQGWKVFDFRNYHDIYKALSESGRSKDSKTYMICAFSTTDDVRNIDPIIEIDFQRIDDELKGLTLDDLLFSVSQNIENSTVDAKIKVKENPLIVDAGGNKFVRSSIVFLSSGKEYESVHYYTVYEDRIFIFSLTAQASKIDSIRQVFEGMIRSFRRT